MYIVDVIPITRGMGRERLSYFTSNKFSVGSVINVPLRSKKVPALIIERREARESKISLRSSDFKIKKVMSRTSKRIFTSAFVSTAEKCGNFFACTTGEALNALTPTNLISDPSKLTKVIKTEKEEHPSSVFVLQGDTEERFAVYKSQIRENFARKSSVLCILPSVREIQNLSATFKKGIEHYTYTLHSSMKPAELIETWNAIAESKHPVLIITTGTFLGVPRHDIGTVIVENENSRSYKQVARPYIDFRVAAELYAQELGAHIIFGDTILRSETIWRERNGEATALSTLKFRTSSLTEIDIMDMRTPEKLPQQEKKKVEFKVFSDDTIELIHYILKQGGRLFLFANRKGMASVTVCGDCGSTVTCEYCSAPMVLYSDNTFICQKCKAVRNADETCDSCGSWNLQPLGIGIERVVEELLTLGVPEESLYRIDADTTTTHLKAQKEMNAFLSSNRSILVGTQMAINYLSDGSDDLSLKVDHAVIVSLDSLFSIPDFRMNENILHIITQLRLRVSGHLIIQTRLPDQSIFDYSIKGNLLDFFKEELEGRKHFNYPPYTRFVKISLWGPAARVKKRMEQLTDYLADYKPEIYPAFTSKVKNKYGMHALLKIPRAEWPNPELLSMLQALPQEYSIDVEPTNIL